MAEAEKTYGEDFPVREELVEWTKEWKELQELEQAMAESRAALEEQFEKDNRARRLKIEQLRRSLQTPYESLQDYVKAKAMNSERRTFMAGTVIAQKRSRLPENIDYGALYAWAQKHELSEYLIFPKKPGEELLEYVRNSRPDLMILDEKAAAKEASRVDSRGIDVYMDTPVREERYITQMSWEIFAKLMNGIVIETEVDAREAKDV